MAMSKKDFIALADVVKGVDRDFAFVIARGMDLKEVTAARTMEEEYIVRLADFCAAQNPRFNRERWLSYIAGTCGPNGGKR